MNYSPIVCFGFDRPMHLNRMLESLEANKEALKSDVYICIDGPSKNTNLDNHAKTVEVANKSWNFNSKTIIAREENLDCRTNIITTISDLFAEHEKLIIIEDDLILSKNFLNYMNSALNKYENNKEMWHINGYSYPQMNSSSNSSISTYISPWGWGTWKDRWEIFINEDFDKRNFIYSLEESERKRFNVNGLYDWEDIIVKNEIKKISAWDAYWYQAVFLNNGLSLYPNRSHTQNEGFDGTGMHCSNISDWKTPLNTGKTKNFPDKIQISRLFNFNTVLFYKIYNYRRYYRYHKDKFSSVENFMKFLKKKLNLPIS